MHNSWIYSEAGSSFSGSSVRRSSSKKKKLVKISGKVRAAATTITTTPYEEIKEYELTFNL